MKHAGVAVSVTTFTDVIAFFVGSNTLLPVLQSFCVYAAVSIFTIYALQVTHFVAWFSLGKNLILFFIQWLHLVVSYDTQPLPQQNICFVEFISVVEIGYSERSGEISEN